MFRPTPFVFRNLADGSPVLDTTGAEVAFQNAMGLLKRPNCGIFSNLKHTMKVSRMCVDEAISKLDAAQDIPSVVAVCDDWVSGCLLGYGANSAVCEWLLRQARELTHYALGLKINACGTEEHAEVARSLVLLAEVELLDSLREREALRQLGRGEGALGGGMDGWNPDAHGMDGVDGPWGGGGRVVETVELSDVDEDVVLRRGSVCDSVSEKALGVVQRVCGTQCYLFARALLIRSYLHKPAVAVDLCSHALQIAEAVEPGNAFEVARCQLFLARAICRHLRALAAEEHRRGPDRVHGDADDMLRERAFSLPAQSGNHAGGSAEFPPMAGSLSTMAMLHTDGMDDWIVNNPPPRAAGPTYGGMAPPTFLAPGTTAAGMGAAPPPMARPLSEHAMRALLLADDCNPFISTSVPDATQLAAAAGMAEFVYGDEHGGGAGGSGSGGVGGYKFSPGSGASGGGGVMRGEADAENEYRAAAKDHYEQALAVLEKIFGRDCQVGAQVLSL